MRLECRARGGDIIVEMCCRRTARSRTEWLRSSRNCFGVSEDVVGLNYDIMRFDARPLFDCSDMVEVISHALMREGVVGRQR